MTISPLAPAAFPDLPSIEGVTFAAAAAGVKYKNRTDVMLALLAPGTSVAGVFTRSATRSAPVLDCQAKLGGDPGSGAAILVNSGNSQRVHRRPRGRVRQGRHTVRSRCNRHPRGTGFHRLDRCHRRTAPP